jgi:Zn-dependent protease with chaperone function
MNTIKFPGNKHEAASKQSFAVLLNPTVDGLLVQSDNQEELLKYDDLELKPVGHMDNHTILRDQRTGNVIISDQLKFLSALASISSGKLKDKLQARISSHKRETLHIFFGWTSVAAAVILIIILVCTGADLVAGLALAQVPPSVETALGKAFFESYALHHRMEAQSSQSEHIQEVGSKLTEKLGTTPYQFKFFIESNSSVNAFALPGGYIVLHSELVKRAKNDDELACVMSHEIGHVIKRHAMRAAFYSAGSGLCLLALFKGQNSLVFLLRQFLKLDQLRYSRAQEKEADGIGVKLAMDAGYDPANLITFFVRLKKELGNADNRVLEILSSHPMTDERVAYIHNEICRLKQKY